MAIVIEGLSRCPICESVLDNSKAYMLVPPLISDENDPLFLLSDAGVHVACIDKNPLREKLFFHIEEYSKHFPIANQICIVDRKPITIPENLVFFGLLTSVESEPLYEFNYVVLNEANAKLGKECERFIEAASKFLYDRKWNGFNGSDKLDFLIKKLS